LLDARLVSTEEEGWNAVAGLVAAVPNPIAVRKLESESAVTVLSALRRRKVMALGLASVNTLDPTVVAPIVVLAAAALVAINNASPTVVDPKFCRALAALVALVPPEATDKVPAILVKLTVAILDDGIIPTILVAVRLVKLPPLLAARFVRLAEEA
jgi:hypothetical protein